MSTLKELLKEAQALAIPGRTKMKKDELLLAIEKATRPAQQSTAPLSKKDRLLGYARQTGGKITSRQHRRAEKKARRNGEL